MEEKNKKKAAPAKETVAKADYDELNNKYLRALADYQNMSKRIDSERQRMFQEATRHVVSSLIAIKDDVDKAEAFSQEPGLQLIKKKIVTVLESMGVTEINPLNQPFLPETMECIHVVEGQPGNLVVSVHSLGYKNGEHLIRPATVTVQREPEITITN